MKGLGWGGDRREVRPFRADAGQDIKTKHENINWKGLDDNGD
jgi:hypothetical protein